MRSRARSGFLLLLGVASRVLGACGGGGDSVPGTFTVDFPTTAAAIASLKMTQGIQVFAYSTSAFGAGDAAAAGACQSLVEGSRTKVIKVSPVATSAVVTACDLMGGKGSLPVPFGNYAFLAVAQSSGADYLVGCAEQTISSTNTAVVIPLTLAADTDSVPSTKCSTLAQACPSGSGC